MKTIRSTVGAAVPVVPDDQPSEHRTREAVVRQLMVAGPLTAAALADRLGLSAAGVRRHLEALLDEGAVGTRDVNPNVRRGRGRPAKLFLLTAAGRARMPHAYDQLAVEALDFLADTVGPEAVTAFARRRAEAVLDPFRDQLAASPDIAGKAEVLATALTAAGFSASIEKVGVGEQLCQHHCPVGHVAARFPQLCEEETAVFTEALGTYAQRLATIAHGDSACTTFIPAAAVRMPVHAAAAPAQTAAPQSASDGRTTS